MGMSKLTTAASENGFQALRGRKSVLRKHAVTRRLEIFDWVQGREVPKEKSRGVVAQLGREFWFRKLKMVIEPFAL